MEKLGEVVLELRTDDKQLDKGIDSAHAKAQGLSKQFDATAESLKGAGQVLPELDGKLGDVGDSLRSASDEAASAASSIGGAGDAARGASDDFTDGAASAKVMGATLGLLATVGFEAKDTLRDIGVELEEIANRAGRTTEPLKQFASDLKGVFLVGPFAVFAQTFREVNEELDRLGSIRTIRDLGGDISLADRLALKLAETLGLIAGKIRELPSLPERFDLAALSRGERTLAGLATATDKLQNSFDRLEPPETARIARSKELSNQLKGLAAQSRASTERLRDLREEHEASLDAIRDQADLEENLAETMQMVTQEAQDQVDAQRELAETLRQFDLDELAKDADRYAAAMDEIFPEEAEVRRIQELRDAIAHLEVTDPEKFAEANRRIDKMVDSTDDWVDSLENVADLIDMAFGDLNSDLADTAREIVRMIDSVTRLAGAWDDLSKAQKAAGAAGVAGQAVDLFGLGGEGEKSGAFGGSGGGDYADVGAQAGAVIGAVIGAAIAGYFTGGLFAHEGAVIGAAIGGLIGEVIGGFINRGADEGLGQLQLVAGEIETKVLRDEGGLGKAIQSIGDAVIENLNRVTDLLQVTVESLPTVDIKVRGENIVAKVGEYRKVFQDIDEAIQFLVTETLRAAEFSGGLDEAFTQILEAGRFGDLEGLSEQLSLIDELVTAEKIYVQGLSAMEIKLEGLPRKLSLLRTELENMGLSVDQVTRLTGAALVQQLSQARQAITGEELSVAQRQEIQKAEAMLWNAEKALQIARLEAERQALIASANIGQAEVQLHSNVLDGRAAFAAGSAEVFKGELGVLSGFNQAGAAIVRTGLEAIGAFVDAAEGVLAGLPDDIRKQIEAIDQVLAALRAIPDINIGGLRLPGLPSIPTAPRAPSAPSAPGPGGGVTDPAEEARRAIEDLINSLIDLADETQQTIGQMQSAVEDLADFQSGLLVGSLSPLPPGRQIAELEAQLAQARTAFLGGDVTAAADIQRLAQQLLQVTQATFGAAGPGFQSRFRDIQEILNETIGAGNEFIETELEELQAMRGILADLLEANPRAHELSEEQTRAIRDGNEDNRTGLGNVAERVDDLEGSLLAELRSLRRAIVELAEAA